MRQGGTVLVVDDEPPIRLLCKINLELEGYRVLEAGGVDEARAAIERDDVDAVLLDVHLGGDDGLALMPAIEDRGRPVALLTGSPGTHLPDGATVIGKPFSIEDLSQTVRRLVAPAR